jgi:hypothetical protein
LTVSRLQGSVYYPTAPRLQYRNDGPVAHVADSYRVQLLLLVALLYCSKVRQQQYHNDGPVAHVADSYRAQLLL